MPRALSSAQREDTVAQVLLGCLPPQAPGTRVLVVEDTSGKVAATLRVQGLAVRAWQRWAQPDQPAQPWPAPGPYQLSTVRLSHTKVAFEMALHAALSQLEPGGRIWVYGANDEGIRSTTRLLEPLVAEVEVADTRRHCRVLTGVYQPGATPLRGTLAAWRQTNSIALPPAPLPLTSYPGIFARGGLDPATAALLAVLPAMPDGARILDFACGAGVIACQLARLQPGLQLHLLDADALAVAAARENLPQAQVFLGNGWAALPERARYDRVVSNPPLHRGKQRDDRIIRSLITGAASRLRPAGELWLVTQRPVPVQRWFTQALSPPELVWENGRFRVWRARKPS